VALADFPMVLILVGLVAYVVLGGADFGAGLWYMLLGGDRRAKLRDHTYHAMGPVWEANHVWLIFVLVIAWTAYPRAFGSIASTLYVPLFVAALGIILRGGAYALRGSATGPREAKLLGAIFGASSVLTPFALGTAVGALASGRVPVGNAAGDPITSWLNATSVFIGVLSVVTSVYLAAVWLTADGAREGRDDLVQAFRRLATISGVLAGALALAGLPVLHEDARRIFDGLTSGEGLAAVIGSGVAGAATLGFVRTGRYEWARYAAATAVAAIVTGWALAQRPEILPGLTVYEAAASDSVLTALIVAAVIGAVVLVPSLVLLFSLVLRGRFDARPEERGSMEEVATEPEPVPGREAAPPADDRPPRALAAVTAASALLGVGLLLVTEGGVGRVAGVLLLLAAVGCGWALVLPSVARGEPMAGGPDVR
jgi:cytochrome d ubiquinol oxidase subunit II